MYDAVLVGAGSLTAMLLARSGYRVLLADRATFPSDTISTHIVWPGEATLAVAPDPCLRRRRVELEPSRLFRYCLASDTPPPGARVHPSAKSVSSDVNSPIRSGLAVAGRNRERLPQQPWAAYEHSRVSGLWETSSLDRDCLDGRPTACFSRCRTVSWLTPTRRAT